MPSAKAPNELYVTIDNVRSGWCSFGPFPDRETLREWLGGFGFKQNPDGSWASGTPRIKIATRRPRRTIYDFRKIWAWPPNIPGGGRWDTFTGT